MRDVDERVAAVQGRVRRIKRKRDRAAVGALATLSVVVFAVLASVPFIGEQTTASSGTSTLFGAASLFGPSAGGYVLVALVAAVAAVLITVFAMMRSRANEEKETLSYDVVDSADEKAENEDG